MLALYVIAVTSAAHSEFDFEFLMSESLYLYAFANNSAVVTMPEIEGRSPVVSAREGIEQAQSIDNDKVRCMCTSTRDIRRMTTAVLRSW
jgi:hypothetical protein